MSLEQQLITIAICVGVTVLTRFMPFLVFAGRSVPVSVHYLGDALPLAIFGMLVVYCLKDVQWLSVSSCLPALVAVIVTALVHLRKHQMMLSIAGGTLVYVSLLYLIGGN